MRDEITVAKVAAMFRRRVNGFEWEMRMPRVLMPVTGRTGGQKGRRMALGVAMCGDRLAVRMMARAAESGVQKHHEKHETIDQRGHKGISMEVMEWSSNHDRRLKFRQIGIFDHF